MTALNVLERLHEIDICLEKAQRGRTIELAAARSKLATLRNDMVSSSSPQRRALIEAINNALASGNGDCKVTLSRAEWELLAK
jgi:hypothetical protein